MRLAVTMMVRDEADILAATLEHHLAQGVDQLIITDNGSTDGTREILAAYESDPRIEVFDEPVQRKQQWSVVTGMARRAAAVHRADWVINADADEFFVPVDRTRGLRDVFERLDPGIGAFTANVVNLTGMPARSGVGLSRLDRRDLRDDEALLRAAGLHAQPTPDAIHVGAVDVEVAQGNHFVSLPSHGEPDPADRIEVLHLPWRSWTQFEAKVRNAGSAYRANPGLTPSPRHHGLRDYRFLLAGCLEAMYVLRHPDPRSIDESIFPQDRWLRDELTELHRSGFAVVPDAMARIIESDDDGLEYEVGDFDAAAAIAPIVLALDELRTQDVTAERERAAAAAAEMAERLSEARDLAHDFERRLIAADASVEEIRSSRTFRLGAAMLAPARVLRSTAKRLRS